VYKAIFDHEFRGKIKVHRINSIYGEGIFPQTISFATVTIFFYIYRSNEDLATYNNFFKSSPLTGSGFFVEVGAYDGVKESNTRVYEECLGWKVRQTLISVERQWCRLPLRSN